MGYLIYIFTFTSYFLDQSDHQLKHFERLAGLTQINTIANRKKAAE